MDFKVEGPWNTEKYCRPPCLADKKHFWNLDTLEWLKQFHFDLGDSLLIIFALKLFLFSLCFPLFFCYAKKGVYVCMCGAMRCGGFSNSSVIRQKGESQNGCFKKTKHAKFSEKRTCAYQGIKMFVFRKIWRALFPWNTHFEIRPFALLLTIYCSKLILLLKLFNVLDEKYYLRGLFIWWLIHKITLWSCCSYSLIYYLITKINSFYN